jgi:hypothetical protein
LARHERAPGRQLQERERDQQQEVRRPVPLVLLPLVLGALLPLLQLLLLLLLDEMQ